MEQTSAGRVRASGRTWRRIAFCVRSGPGAGAGCSSSVRRGRSRLRLCRTSDGCAGETPRRRPARSRCAWHGNGNPAGCARAGRGHSRPSDPRRSTPRPGESGGKGRSTPSGRWLGADEAPEFIQLQHVAWLSRQKRVLNGGQTSAFFPSHLETDLAPIKRTSGCATREHYPNGNITEQVRQAI